eukprot:9791136-Alexandrium_andersonii.AAC.1
MLSGDTPEALRRLSGDSPEALRRLSGGSRDLWRAVASYLELSGALQNSPELSGVLRSPLGLRNG